MEDNLKRLISETTRLCREQGIKVEPHVVSYLACLQEAQTSWEDIAGGAQLLNTRLEPSAIAAMSQVLYNLLTDKDSPMLATAKMQVMMAAAFRQQLLAIEREQAETNEAVDMLARAVTGPKPLKDTSMESYEKFYKLVMEYVCTKAGLERAKSDEGAAEEVRAAMESVFPLSTLARFLTLTEAEKTQQIEELARITLGICLYNRSIGKGGNVLPAAFQSYLPQAQRVQRDLARHAADITKELQTYQSLAKGLDDQGQERARQELTARAQALVLFEALQVDVAGGLDGVQQLEAELQHVMLQVQDAIGGSSAVPKEVVYPLFDRLGMLHAALNSELRLFVVRQRLYDELVSLQDGFISLLQGRRHQRHVSKTLHTSSSSTQQAAGSPEAEHQAAELELPDLPDTIEYEEPSTSRTGLALKGFCPVSLVQGPSMLLLADPSLGSLRYTDQSFGFANAAALKAHTKDHPCEPALIEGLINAINIIYHTFTANPAGILSKVEACIPRQPVLASLLGIEDNFPVLNLQAIVGISSGPLKVDFGCQTPMHFVERHIDYSYEWNEWALRRRALALANLQQKRTHSTQTGLTHFKRDGETQVWQPKNAQVQTRVNKGQSMPKKLQYVAGLRGAADTKMNVIRLELDLGQPHQY